MLLVGNKSDLIDQRQVRRDEAETFAKDLDMFYLESSAKTGDGITDVFAILALLMIGEDVPPEMLNGETLGGALVPKKSKVPEAKFTSVPNIPATAKPVSIPKPTPIGVKPSAQIASKPTALKLSAVPLKPSSLPKVPNSQIDAKPAVSASAFTPKPVMKSLQSPVPVSPIFVPKPSVSSKPAAVQPAETKMNNIPKTSGGLFVPKVKPSSPPTSISSATKPQPMAPGEKKASLVGKPIDSSKPEPQWFAPSVPKKSSKAAEIKSSEISEIEENEEIEEISESSRISKAAVPVITSVSKPGAKSVQPLSKDFSKNPFMGPKKEEKSSSMSKASASPFSSSSTSPKGVPAGNISPALKPVAPATASQDEGEDGKRQSRFAGFLNALQGKAKPDTDIDKKPEAGFIPFTGNPSSSQSIPFSPANKSAAPILANNKNPFANAAASVKSEPATVADESKNQLTCLNCGSVLNKAFKFCNKCGYRVQ
jgi:hypothetical protein